MMSKNWHFDVFTSKNYDFQFFTNLLKNPKAFYAKKFFASEFDETQNLNSLWHKDLQREIWAKSGSKFFLA